MHALVWVQIVLRTHEIDGRNPPHAGRDEQKKLQRRLC